MTKRFETETIFSDVVAAIDRRDIEAAVELFAEDGVVVDFSNPDVVVTGRSAIAANVREFLDFLPDLKFEIVTVIANEDRLAAELLLKGTPQGQSAAITMQCSAFYAFQHGKIQSEHLYMDSAQLSAETGTDHPSDGDV